MVKLACVFVSLLGVLASCGGGDGPSYAANCQGVVDYVADCRRDFPGLDLPTDAEVEQGCAALALEPECYELTFAEGCEAQESDAPPTAAFLDMCTGPCTEGDPSICSGDTIDVCIDAGGTGETREWTFNCDGFCELQGGTYVGECSDNLDGQDSGTGEDVCWCEGI